MKNKVGIISINKYGSLNYGTVLHSFAFQTYLNKRNIDSVIIDYIDRYFKYLIPHFPVIGLIKNNRGLRRLKGFIMGILIQPSADIKYKKILKFCNKNYKMVNNNDRPFTQIYFEKMGKISSFDFDTIVCESDVIWSPKDNCGFDRAFFADYECFKSMKKVAYSPSISNVILTKEQEQDFKKLVINFDFLSARENETAEYIRNLTGKECKHVLDPTLLLDEQDYAPIIAKIKEKKKYLLCYNLHNDKLMISKARKLAKKMNIEFIEVNMNMNIRNKIYHRTLITLGIEEWLGYFKNAEFIVTNGFHGMCFSIIFKKDFYVYLRRGNLKFNLVYKLGLESRFINEKNIEQELENIPIDYDSVYEKLNAFRKISEDYINEAIIN